MVFTMKTIAIYAILAIVTAASAQEKEKWTPAQIKQIEEIAQGIAAKTNADAQTRGAGEGAPDHAIARGRNVTFVHYIKLRPGVSQPEIDNWQRETSAEIMPRACRLNKSNAAFDRGLSYTYNYQTRDGRQLGQVLVDKSACRRAGF